jgi:hypothetical protein
MTAPLEIGHRGSSAGMLEKRREEMTRALTMRDGWDIALLDDDEFERELALNKVRVERVERIIKNDCIENIDYGKVPGVDKPFAWEGAADKIARRLRWSALLDGPPSIQQVGEALTVTVTCVIRDSAGHDLLAMSRSCSTFEKRFRKKSGGWKFVKPEEAINELVAMAFKRARVAGVLSAAGVKHLFANPDQLREDEEVAKEAAEDAKPLTLEGALNFPVKGKPLSAIRNTGLVQLDEWAQGKLQEDPDSTALARLLEAVHLVQEARKAGTVEEPPKTSQVPLTKSGYDQDAPREPGDE